jgi:hypothetical protein
MGRQLVVLAAACAVGAAVVAALLMARGRDAEDIRVSTLQRRLETLEGRVAMSEALSGGPSTVALRDQGTPSATRDQAEELQSLRAAAMPGEQAALPFMDPNAAAERRRYEAGVIEQTLATQQIDVSASNSFAVDLTHAFGEEPELAGNQLLDAECRATLCRIAVLQRSDEDVDLFLGHVGTLPGFDNTETYWQRQLNADGSSVMTMYVARQGQKLPDYEMHHQDLANQ